MKYISAYIKKLGLLTCILLFLFLLNPFGLINFFGYGLVAIILTKKDFLLKNLDSTFLLLLLFSIAYAAFYAMDPDSVQLIFVYALFPSSFYLFGKYIFTQLGHEKTKLFYFLFTVGAIYSFTPLISVLLNIREGGFGQLDRSLPLFWNGAVLTATLLGSHFTFNMCIPALLIVKQKTSGLLFKGISLFLFFLSLACVLRIGSRTQILIFIFVLLCSLIYIIPRQSFRRNIITFALFFAGVLFLITNISLDWDQDWLSAFAGRMEKNGGEDIASGGGRTQRWVKSLEYLFTKPLGWSEKEFGHAHNLWLDVLRVTGVIPFLLLIMFFVRSFFSIKSAISIDKHQYAFNNQILVYYIAILLLFMVEPVIEGMFSLFCLFCLFIGVLNKYRTSYQYNEKI